MKMALLIQTSSPSFVKKPLLLHHSSFLVHFPTKIKFIVRAESSSEEQESRNGGVTGDDGSSVLAPSKKPSSIGLGFGSSVSSSDSGKENGVSSKKKKRNRKERASIIRRSPVEKPTFLSQEEAQNEDKSRNETAFLLTWLGLGSLILIEGIALAASGFLPEEWDKFFVKYLYPSFTPTVFLFIAGTVGYGVLKYLQGEKMKS